MQGWLIPRKSINVQSPHSEERSIGPPAQAEERHSPETHSTDQGEKGLLSARHRASPKDGQTAHITLVMKS